MELLQRVRNMGGSQSSKLLAACATLALGGMLAVSPAAAQEEKPAVDVEVQSEQPAAQEAREDVAEATDKTAESRPEVEIRQETPQGERETEVDVNPRAWAEVIAVIRQLRSEVAQLRRELAEVRGDREPRLGDRGPRRDGERVGIVGRRDGERRDDERRETAEVRRERDGRDGDRIENRGERRDERAENREDRQEDREENREDRAEDRANDDEETRNEDDRRPRVENRQERRDDREDRRED